MSAEPGNEAPRLRRTLAVAAAGAVANAVWLAISIRDADLLAGLLSGMGLIFCAVPTVLCARRLARGPGDGSI